MKELFYAINLPFGLHARPAAHVAQIASGVKSQVTIEKDGKLANAKNVLQILSLDIKKGEEIHLMIEGEDELEAADKLEAFFRDHPVEKLDKQKVFKIAFFGSCKIRTSVSSESGSSVNRIGRRPKNSGIIPNLRTSSTVTLESRFSSLSYSSFNFARNPIEAS